MKQLKSFEDSCLAVQKAENDFLEEIGFNIQRMFISNLIHHILILFSFNLSLAVSLSDLFFFK